MIGPATEPSTNGQHQDAPTEVPAPQLARLADLLGDWEVFAAEAHEAYRTGAKRGPTTGLPSLDRELGGALAAGTHVLHAGPGAGKTALALQVAASCGATPPGSPGRPCIGSGAASWSRA